MEEMEIKCEDNHIGLALQRSGTFVCHDVCTYKSLTATPSLPLLFRQVFWLCIFMCISNISALVNLRRCALPSLFEFSHYTRYSMPDVLRNDILTPFFIITYFTASVSSTWWAIAHMALSYIKIAWSSLTTLLLPSFLPSSPGMSYSGLSNAGNHCLLYLWICMS